MDANPLYAWLRARGFWVYSSGKGKKTPAKTRAKSIINPIKLTHVFLDGGRASVPESQCADFWGEYARVLAAYPSIDQHVVELVPPGGMFKMFLDLDISFAPEEHRHLPDIPQAQLTSDIVAEVLKHLPAGLRHGAVEVMASMTTDERVDRVEKIGIHMVWCDVIVDKGGAQQLRSAIVEEMCSRKDDSHKGHLAQLAWPSIFDASVYATGLRAVYSCKGVSAARCRIYVPSLAATFADDGSLLPPKPYPVPAPKTDVSVVVQRCSIHASPELLARARRVLGQDQGPPAQGQGRAPTRGPTLSRARTQNKITPAREKRLRACLPVVYQDADFTSMHIHDDHAVIYMDSRFCHNLGADHNSNRVYLVLDVTGVRQKCFCRCDTVHGRRSGEPCSRFVHLLSSANPLGFKKVEYTMLEDELDAPEEQARPKRPLILPPKDSTNAGANKTLKTSLISNTNTKIATKSTKTTNATKSTKTTDKGEKPQKTLRKTTRSINTDQDALHFWCRKVQAPDA
jgi:hypothetical protein